MFFSCKKPKLLVPYFFTNFANFYYSICLCFWRVPFKLVNVVCSSSKNSNACFKCMFQMQKWMFFRFEMTLVNCCIRKFNHEHHTFFFHITLDRFNISFFINAIVNRFSGLCFLLFIRKKWMRFRFFMYLETSFLYACNEHITHLHSFS